MEKRHYITRKKAQKASCLVRFRGKNIKPVIELFLETLDRQPASRIAVGEIGKKFDQIFVNFAVLKMLDERKMQRSWIYVF